jgi:hypothetical protein
VLIHRILAIIRDIQNHRVATFPAQPAAPFLLRSLKFRLTQGIAAALKFGGRAMFTKAGQTFWGGE